MAKSKQAAVIENGSVYILQSNTPVFVKTGVLMAISGKSEQWIGRLANQGVITKTDTPHGAMYNLREAMSEYCAMLENRAGAEQTEKLETQRLETDLSLKKAKAIIAAHEAKEIQGKMHRSEDVADMTTDLVYAVRGILLALPGRLSVDVCTAETPAEASKIIRDEVYKAMEELSRYEYDPRKYEERVRERKKWSVNERTDGDDE